MYIELNEEEYEEFIKYATSTEKLQGEEWNKLREKFQKHVKVQEYNPKESEQDELVQYFIVNSELNMSAGKIAAQVAHVATIISYEYGQRLMTHLHIDDDSSEKFSSWYTNNQPKIILRGKHKQMKKLIDQGWYYIHDLGRTEIAEGSLTVVGCAPEYKSVIKPIVKRFQLL